MRHRRRLHRRERKLKNKKIIISMFALVLFLSCGYAAFSTSISLTAKGSIKETFTIDQLKETVVSSGDGLYLDDYGYIYKGTAPSNYIKFNNEVWRIISIENDNTIKIIRNESIGNYIWDSTDNDWETASLNTYLNSNYYNSLSEKTKIVLHSWNVGTVTYQENNFDQTLAEDISQESAITYTMYVGLINISDYARTNTNASLCGTVNLNNYNANNYDTCKNTTWLSTHYWYWTINPETPWNGVWNVDSCGYIGINSGVSAHEFAVRPVLFLSSDIKLKGQGTENQPYEILSS